jgi:ABC-type uncharacterized transport system permease subunit
MLAEAKLFISLTYYQALRYKAFPLEILASVFANITTVVLFITFWLLVGKYSSSGSIVPRDIISFYLIIAGLTPLLNSTMGIASQTIKHIKDGTLNQVLIKPINPIVYPWTVRIGSNIVSITFGLAMVVVGIVIAGGISNRSLPYLPLVLFNAVMINAAFNIAIGTVGFYFIQASGLKDTFVHISKLCRGELIPLFLMPASVATVLQFSPFPASQYHLSIVLQGTRLPSWGFVILGTIWAIVIMYGSVRFWRYGLKKYEAIGL